LAGLEPKSKSLTRIDNASVARIPFAASNITYVFNLISEQAFKISITSSFDKASLFFLTILGNFTFNLSMTWYKKAFGNSS
jgi:hypothetical protein